MGGGGAQTTSPPVTVVYIVELNLNIILYNVAYDLQHL